MNNHDNKIREILDNFENDLIQRLETLMARNSADNDGKRFMPKIGDDYFSIHGLCLESHTWNDSAADFNLFDIGNCFKTDSEAIFEKNRLKVIARMKEFIGEPTARYTLKGDIDSKWVNVIQLSFPHQSTGGFRFNTEEDAHACIDAIGHEDLLKYYFNYGE